MRAEPRVLVAALGVIAWTMAGLGMTGTVTAAVGAPAASASTELAAPPSDKPTPKPKPTPTAAPATTAAPTPRPTPRPTAAPTPPPTVAPTPTPTPTPMADGAGSGGTASGRPSLFGIDVDPASMFGRDGIGLFMLATAWAGGILLVAVARRRRRTAALAAEATVAEPGAAGADGHPAPPGHGIGPPAPPPDEAHIPRWRRPSVRAERFGARHVTGARRPPLIFAGPPDAATERLLVRFDQVTLYEEPDEALGRTLELLGTGDQVELLERGPIWALVRTPTGRTGWLLAMTLGSDEAPGEAEPVAWVPPEPEPDAELDDGPSLEFLLETIINERRERERAAAAAASAEASAPSPPSRPRRSPRTRTRPSST